jgi:hypothetical protein
MNMQKLFSFAVAAMLIGALASCNQGSTAPIGAELDNKIDSIKQARLELLTTDMQKACDEKMKTEVMVKADSIAKAMKENKAS